MSSIWLEVRRALREDAERAGGRAEAPLEGRDGVGRRGHVHDQLHDRYREESRALQRIGGREPEPAYYPAEGKDTPTRPGRSAKKEAGA